MHGTKPLNTIPLSEQCTEGAFILSVWHLRDILRLYPILIPTLHRVLRLSPQGRLINVQILLQKQKSPRDIEANRSDVNKSEKGGR